MTDLTDKLLPCPFCGDKKPTMWPMVGMNDGSSYKSPFCEICGATIMETVQGEDTGALIKAWNTRAKPPEGEWILVEDCKQLLELDGVYWLRLKCMDYDIDTDYQGECVGGPNGEYYYSTCLVYITNYIGDDFPTIDEIDHSGLGSYDMSSEITHYMKYKDPKPPEDE